jgi:glycosyltransferase involved in cell wall biosynthesis
LIVPDYPLVSIITPVFNGAKFIETLIHSVQIQDYPRIEHIIIDDGSQDGGDTVAILKKFPHLRWWSRENRGQYASMNDGLNAAQGEFVCFICADDMLADGAIRQVMEFIKSHPGYVGVYGYTAFMHEDRKTYLPAVPFRNAPFKYYAYLWHVQHCSLYLRKDILVEKNLFLNPQLRYVGDYDWMIRLIQSSIKIGHVKKTLSWIRVHDNQISACNRKKMKLERETIAKKNHLNPFLYSFSIAITIWSFNFYKLFFAIKQSGLKGGSWLIKKRLRKRNE